MTTRTRRHHKRHKKFSACTHFSKTRRLCTEPCKYVFRQLKDANTGMMKTVGHCKTKYNHFKKHGKKTKGHKRRLKKLGNDIKKLEKATNVAKKANEDVSKIGMNMEIPVPSVADISKTVGNFFSSGPAEAPAPAAAPKPVAAAVEAPAPVPVEQPVKGGK